jgi:formate dehydrogenase subunit delta
MNAEKIVRMANQIATAFRHEGEDAAAASTLKHLKDFWDPRMRRALIAHHDAGGDGLSPVALRAAEMLAERERAAAR